MVRVGNAQGTAFTIEVNKRQYLITAKHVVASLKPSDSIQVFSDNRWQPLNVKVFRCKDPVDIAVLVPPFQITQALPLEPTLSNMVWGQDMYFLGFPFGMSIPGGGTNGSYPIAIVKKGILSAISSQNGAKVILLDGYNDPGFSGGPIVFRHIGGPRYTFYLAGVITGFRPELVPVTKPVAVKPNQDLGGIESWRIVHLRSGQKAILEDTQEFVPLNTGIIVGYSIEPAVNLIHQHPVGPEIKK